MQPPPNGEYATFTGKNAAGFFPFTGGAGQDPATGLNNAYWQVLDYLLATAAAAGITIFLNLLMGEDLASGVAGSWTNAQFQAYGNAVATRYLNQPNIVWMMGDDGGTDPTTATNIMTGVRAAGDTRPVSFENGQETTSRFGLKLNDAQPWNSSGNIGYQWVYTYAPSYGGVEYAYLESSPLPVLRGDGYYFGTIGGADDKVSREQFWWSVSSGSKGYSWGTFDGGMNAGFASGWQANLVANAEEAGTAGDFQNTVMPLVTAYVESLPNWQKLAADASNTLITAGRGTRAPYQTEGIQNQYTGATPDTYVSGSYAADGSIAMIYFSRGVTTTITTTASTIMASGYTATWVDPANCATTPGTAANTYTKPTGANSAGDHDWLLVLQAPAGGGPAIGTASAAGAGAVSAVVTQGAIATAAGAGAVTAKATVITTAAAAGAGAVTDVVTQIAPGAAAGAGAVTDVATQIATAAPAGAGAATALATQIAGASATGAGAVTDVATQIAGAAAAGAGSVTAAGSGSGSATASIAGAGATTAVVTQIAPATAAGAGSVTAAAVQAATATAAGAGAATAVATQIAPAAAAGAGAAAAVATQAATAAAAGAGAVTDVATQIATASAAGAGAATANGTQPGGPATASASGAGAATAVVTQAVTATAPGAGAVTTTATQAAKATAAGAGAVSASGVIPGTASIAGAGAATAKATQAATAAPAGAGVLTALAAQAATAALAGAGAVSAAGHIQLAFTVGTLTAADKARRRPRRGDGTWSAHRREPSQPATSGQEDRVARYPNGQPVRVSATVKDVTGALTDAGTLTLLVKLAVADGTSLTTGTYTTPTHDSTGTYHQDIPVTDLAANGHYQYTWTSTGAGAGVSYGEFDVFDPFETSILPLQDAKDALNIPQATTTSDAEIAAYLATIRSCFERYTGGPVVNKTITAERTEMMAGQTVIPVRQRPLVSVTSITSASGGTIDISAGLDIDANAGLIRRTLGLPFIGPFFSWLPVVTVTYVAGWGVSVPAAFNVAARIILQHIWETQRGATYLPMTAGEMTMPPGFGFAIPNAAAELLDGAQGGIPFLSQAYV